MTTEAKPNTSEEEGKNSEKADAEGAGTDTAKNQDAPKFTQKDQDNLAAKIRKEEKEKFERKLADEKRAADEAKAAQQGEFEKLANDRKAKLDELEPKLTAAESELETYRTAVAVMAKTELKSLPEEVRELSPAQFGEDKVIQNPLDVLAWLPKGKALAEKLEGAAATPGAGRDPKAKGAAAGDLVNAERQRLMSKGKYAL